MYKSFRITKRLAIAFDKFPKTAKKVHKVYNTGFHKWTDTTGNVDNYSVVIGLFRVMFYVEHKHKCGHCCG